MLTDNANAQAKPAPSLEELARKRLRRFMGLLPKVLNDEDPEAVHDLRVWSRRLQQVLVTMFPKPRPQQAQNIVRALRRARRAVGGWRDCDVLLDLLARRVRRVRNPDERRAWESVQAAVAKRRGREIRRARRKIAHRRLFTLAQDVARLTESAAPRDHGGDEAAVRDPGRILASVIASAYEGWKDALARARKTSAPADVHAFRIESKRLRYRIELARDLGAADAVPALERLKSLQDGLGRLHDRGEAARMAAEALADAEFLAGEPRAASLLLRRLAREKKREPAETAAQLRAADEARFEIEQWVRLYCGRPEEAAESTLSGDVERAGHENQ